MANAAFPNQRHMNTNYQNYAHEYVSRWARKIAARAGCEYGKGGRGKKIRLRARLLEEMAVEVRAWERYEAGTMLPRPGNLRRIHELAKQRGFLGHQGIGGLLARIQDAAPMMAESEFEYWQEQELREMGASDADFDLARHETWLWSLERAYRLEYQAAALLNEAARIQSARAKA